MAVLSIVELIILSVIAYGIFLFIAIKMPKPSVRRVAFLMPSLIAILLLAGWSWGGQVELERTTDVTTTTLANGTVLQVTNSTSINQIHIAQPSFGIFNLAIFFLMLIYLIMDVLSLIWQSRKV